MSRSPTRPGHRDITSSCRDGRGTWPGMSADNGPMRQSAGPSAALIEAKRLRKFSNFMAKSGGLDQIEDDIKLCEQYLARGSSKDWDRPLPLKGGSETPAVSDQKSEAGCWIYGSLNYLICFGSCDLS
jgi:hypothetical protein